MDLVRMMKRFLLFAGSTYYPAGGWKDFKGRFGTLEEAIAWVADNAVAGCYEWWHVADAATHEIVKASQNA
jgi:hypothetical protein